jgi:FSR family fosmidomycin resistance protein-like MFS transporter
MLAHALVDLFAATIQPLWPDLQRGLALDEATVQWAFVTWSLATSVSQLWFGYWGDRRRWRWLIWAGPALGVVCLSGIGLVHSLWALNALLVVGGLGIAAFHPEAAALAGSGAAGDRGRALSLFSVGGYLGQALGPLYSGALTTQFGLPALAWGVTWGLGALGLLALGLGRVPAMPEAAKVGRPLVWSEMICDRGSALALVLAIGVLRVLAVLGVPLALAFTMKGRGDTNEQIGLAQTVFLGGIGAGSLACALLVHRASERRVLWILPLPAAVLLWAIPTAGSRALLVDAGFAGVLLGATMPILVSYGQQLLPEGQRTASSITMGVTWGLGGLAVAALMAIFNRQQRPELAFAAFASSCLLSSLLCARLPEPERRGEPYALAPAPQPR